MGRTIDLVLRLLYIVVAPLLLAPLAATLPITGTMIVAGLAMVVALIGPRWHAWVGGVPVIGKGLGGMARIGDFYREHPPRPLVYYIFYPLLFLWRPLWRREFTLYRRFNAVALVVIVIGGAWDYWKHWQPELGFGPFLGAMIAGFVIQFFAMFALAMPIVTTVVMLRLRGQTKTLVAVMVIAIGAGTVGAFSAHHMKYAVQFSTYERLRLRTAVAIRGLNECVATNSDPKSCAKNNGALMALARGLDAADTTMAGDPTAFDIAEDRAREQLAAYYKADEARAFHLYYGDGVTVLFVRKRGSQPIWLGYSRDEKKLLLRANQLPMNVQKKIGY